MPPAAVTVARAALATPATEVIGEGATLTDRPAPTVRVKDTVPVIGKLAESVAVTATTYWPLVLGPGVPEMMPVAGARASPVGSNPDERLKRIVPVPSVAATCVRPAHAVPTAPARLDG